MTKQELKQKAIELKLKGIKMQEIADELGASLITVKRWTKDIKKVKVATLREPVQEVFYEYVNIDTAEIVTLKIKTSYNQQLYHYIEKELGYTISPTCFSRVFECSKTSIKKWEDKEPLFQLENLEQIKKDADKFLELNGLSINNKGNLSSSSFCGSYWKEKHSKTIFESVKKALREGSAMDVKFHKNGNTADYVYLYFQTIIYALFEYCQKNNLNEQRLKLEDLPNFVYYKTAIYNELPKVHKDYIQMQIGNKTHAIYLNKVNRVND